MASTTQQGQKVVMDELGEYVPARNGLYKGYVEGNKVQIYHRKDFIRDNWDDEPHYRRQAQILKKYPQIKDLYGPTWETKYHVAILVSTQILLAYLLKDTTNYWLFCFVAYFIGGTINHSCSVGLHEITHYLAFESPFLNRVLACICNLPICAAAAFSFEKYHMDHHYYLGVEGLDTDIATDTEAKFINNRFLRFLNVCFFNFQYSIRPFVLNPLPPTKWEIINWIVQLIFDYTIYKTMGLQGLMYLVASTLFGLGPHPCSGHFISEHFVTSEDGQEIYSCYSPLNWIMFNVGYHNEHHDFPRVPYTKLPLLRKIAPEYYDTLKSYNSWTWILWHFVMSDGYGHYDRIKRTKETNAKAKKDFRMKLKQAEDNKKVTKDNEVAEEEVKAFTKVKEE